MKETAWQLQLFSKTLKKKQRLNILKKLLGHIGASENCLLLTCGDNNGAMNFHLRNLGGQWQFGDFEETNLLEMSEFLKQPVNFVTDSVLNYNNKFNRVILIDVLEHVEDPNKIIRKITTVCAKNAQVIVTTPGGNPQKIVNRLKKLAGMGRETYGHVVDGFSTRDLSEILAANKIKPEKSITFSRFFTELMEFILNFAYVKFLSSKKKNRTIAPQSKTDLAKVRKTYRIYALIYPFIFLVSLLDHFVFFTEGYVSVVMGRPEENG